jgi:hypothetical protein
MEYKLCSVNLRLLRVLLTVVAMEMQHYVLCVCVVLCVSVRDITARLWRIEVITTHLALQSIRMSYSQGI